MADNTLTIKTRLDDKAAKPLKGLHDAYKAFQKDGSKGIAIGAGAAATAKGFDLIGGAVSTAGALVADFIGDSIKEASDLNESTSKSQVIFGKAADAVADFAATADKGLGLSKQAALEAAASFGNLFLGTGQTQAKAADLSKTMVTLAGDLASFNNLDPTETLEKLRSGLTGEAEPLRSVGVFLTEAKVKAKGMELGLADAHGELSEGSKVLARYQIILDETKTAQGDFARTSDGLANSQRIVNAELKNAEAEVGAKLLPLQLALTKAEIAAIPVLVDVANGIETVVGTVIAADRELKNLGDTVPGVAVGFDLLGKAVTLPFQPLFFLKDRLDDTVDALSAADRAAAENAAANAAWAEAAANTAARYSDSSDTISQSAKDAARDVNKSTASMIAAQAKLNEAYLENTQKAVDDYYDVIATKDQLAANSAEISAQKRILASSSATAAEKRDARVALHQLEADQAKYLADLATHGATSGAEFTTAMEKLLKRLAKAHGSEAAAIRDEIRLLNLLAAKAALAHIFDKGSGYQTFGGGQASGGPVSKGTAYLVGEEGPEIFMPGQSGTIIPNEAISTGTAWSPQTGGGSGGGVVINFNSTWPPTPAQAREFAEIVSERLAYEFDRASSTSVRQ